jgi:hypothetical protein
MAEPFDSATLAAYAETLKSGTGKFVFAPVRHHSPACAAHVRQLIIEIKPKYVLIEAPVDFEPLLPLLLDEDTEPPVAIAAFLDRGNSLLSASYYPFCAHSPEFVAMKTASEIGAEIGFIDLPCGDRLMLGNLGEDEEKDEESSSSKPAMTPDPISLLDERLLDVSDYTKALAAQLGCRDGLEVWDHLFESRLGDSDTRGFFADVGAYCLGIRAATPEARIHKDEAPRETHMAEKLLALKRQRGKVIVVTGGFHTPALVNAVASGVVPHSVETKQRKLWATKSFLVRYGFKQLDYLHGYGAGLPSPGFYERLWQTHEDASDGVDFWKKHTVELFVDFATQFRNTDNERNISLPVLQGAIRAAFDLAELRGRPGPLRVDIQDAALSAFVKGEAGASVEMESFAAFISGDKIGNVPLSAGSPPLVEYVRKRARSLRFNIDSSTRNIKELDIYRRQDHLEASRFLHLLSLIGVDFGRLEAGPDFLHSGPSDLLFERWSWAWSPQAEAGLIERSAMGDTPERVGLTIIRQQIASLADDGRGRNASEVVRLFLNAMRAGLHGDANPILAVLDNEIAADPEFTSVCIALRSLNLVWRARSVLGLVDSDLAASVIKKAYVRALYLLPDLAQSAEEHIVPRLEAMVTLNEIVRGGQSDETALDATLFDDALDRLEAYELQPVLAGGLAAILVMSNRRAPDHLIACVNGGLQASSTKPEDKIGALFGVLKVAPELIRRIPGLIRVVDGVIGGVDDKEFITLLPHLRYAFTSLNPGETAAVADTLATLYGISEAEVTMPAIVALSDEETAANLALTASLRAAFEEDGLVDWIDAASSNEAVESP